MHHNNSMNFEADMLSKIVNEWRQNRNCNRLQVKLLKGSPEMPQDLMLEQEVYRDLARTLFMMLG